MSGLSNCASSRTSTLALSGPLSILLDQVLSAPLALKIHRRQITQGGVDAIVGVDVVPKAADLTLGLLVLVVGDAHLLVPSVSLGQVSTVLSKRSTWGCALRARTWPISASLTLAPAPKVQVYHHI